MRDKVFSGSPFEQQLGFCRALQVGDRILVSGTAPMDEQGQSVSPQDPGAQMKRCLEIIREALEKLGSQLDDIVRTRIYLTQAEDWPVVSQVHGHFLGTAQPTATCVVVRELLRPEWRVELEAEAVLPDQLRIGPIDRVWLAGEAPQIFGADLVVSRGRAYQPSQLDGWMARRAGRAAGLLTYAVEGARCQMVTLNAFSPGLGVGTALVAHLEDWARQQDCQELWLVTTNDNLQALHFYQRRGFLLRALHTQALTESRQLKPQIPLVGQHGIEIRDELELYKPLIQAKGVRS